MKIANNNDSWMMPTHDKLFQAIEHGNFWMTNLMIELGADLNARNKGGVTPLEYALALGYQKKAEFIKSKGATE